MSEWTSSESFDKMDFYDPQSVYPSGSSAKPSIGISVDYLLRTENGDPVQYETGEEVSLEII